MSKWKKVREEAGVVLVGNFNPSIFQPEWFIRKGIVEEWDYTGNENITIPDLAKVEFTDDRKLSVLFNKFALMATRASEYQTLHDIVLNTFNILSETPVDQMGMNYSILVEIDSEKWKDFGYHLAPKDPWIKHAEYVSGLDEVKQDIVGLIEITYNLPRPDGLLGHVRPSIKAIDISKRIVSFSINSHVEIPDKSAIEMTKILDNSWDNSLSFAIRYIENTIKDLTR